MPTPCFKFTYPQANRDTGLAIGAKGLEQVISRAPESCLREHAHGFLVRSHGGIEKQVARFLVSQVRAFVLLGDAELQLLDGPVHGASQLVLEPADIRGSAGSSTRCKLIAFRGVREHFKISGPGYIDRAE